MRGRHNDPLAGLDRGLAGVILADPPWGFRPYTDKKLISPKSARAHYETMTTRDLMALDVRSLAAPDCELVCWATQAQIPDALAVVKAWGFEFKTMGAWAKRSKAWKPGQVNPKWAIGTGYRRRSAAEFYIVATRGNPKQAVRNVRNLIEAPVREHSRKPDEMHEELERLYPGVIKYELFARARRPGWCSAGNQTQRFEDGAANRP